MNTNAPDIPQKHLDHEYAMDTNRNKDKRRREDSAPSTPSKQTRTNTKWNVKFNIQERSADIDTRSYTHHFYFGSFNQGTNNQDSKKEKD
uniref:Uncharacterized protein n=1 Tax=Knipowitschia caucasica TaxID=637954 RepID=A0AAV2MDP7_KNICA